MPIVWIVNHYGQSPSGPGGTRHHSLAKHLKLHGWDTLVIASSCEHNTGRQRLLPGENIRLQTCDDVDFLWLRVLGEPAIGNWARFITMILFSLSMVRVTTYCSIPRPDVIIGSTVHPFAALAAWLLARFFYRVPFVFEVRDLWPSTLVAMGAIKKGGPVDHVLAFLERLLAKRSNQIITLMQGGASYFGKMGIPSDRILWLPNGAEAPIKPPVPMCPNPQPFQILYFGAHGPANSLSTVLEAMSLLQRRGVGSSLLVLRMFGDGSSKDNLIELAQRFGLDGVYFEPPVPKIEVESLASKADAFIVAMQPLPELYRYGISFNKLFDYFLAARPVVSASSAAYDPVVLANAGIVVPAGSPLALADAINRMRELPLKERQQMGLNGRAYLEANHIYPKLAKRLAASLNVLIGR